MPASYATNRLDLLPTELYLIIIDNIGHDLIAHVYFSKLTDRIAAVYKARDLGRDFWEPILRTSGLGALDRESCLDDEWERLAYDCAEHAAGCEHPACGLSRLRDNERLMQRHIAAPGFNLMYAVENRTQLDYHCDPVPVWEHITFRRSSVGDGMYIDIPCLRKVDESSKPCCGDDIEAHPVLWRSFVTFSPVRNMTLLGMAQHYPAVGNLNGITVAELLTSIVKVLDQATDNHGLTELMQCVDVPDTALEGEIFPTTWSKFDAFSALTCMRDWFRLVHWIGMEVEDVNEFLGHMVGMRYKIADLPVTYKEYCLDLQRFSD